jgi:hypothetical protein
MLSNIYMDRLDQFVEHTLITAYTRGTRREGHPEYERSISLAYYYRKRGDLDKAAQLRREAQRHPSIAPQDPHYRRLRYVRYADDFLLGFIGPVTEAKEIKERITTFLGTALKLTLSTDKTLITHAHTGKARFLGYAIGIMHSTTKFDGQRRRTVNGKVGLYIPDDVLHAKRTRYLRNGVPIHRSAYLNDSAYDIIIRYQGEYRGLVNYYSLAYNLERLRYVAWTMETSLLKTLACKHQTSVMKERKRLRSTTQTSEGPRTCLKLIIPREHKKPLIAIFGGLALKRRKQAVIHDQVLTAYVNTRSELVERLLKDTCDVCGSHERIEMHHVRKLADLNRQGKQELPLWKKIMIARKRKSIPLCRTCHDDIHANRPQSTRQGNRRAG